MTVAVTTITLVNPINLDWYGHSETSGVRIPVDTDRREQLLLGALDPQNALVPSLASFFDTLPKLLVRRSEINLDEWSPEDISGD